MQVLFYTNLGRHGPFTKRAGRNSANSRSFPIRETGKSGLESNGSANYVPCRYASEGNSAASHVIYFCFLTSFFAAEITLLRTATEIVDSSIHVRGQQVLRRFGR